MTVSDHRERAFAVFVRTEARVAAERRRVVAEALTWRGTPFHHGARLKGVGVDCGQLVLAVYEVAGVLPRVEPETYPPSFAASNGGDTFILQLAREHCVEIPLDHAAIGSVVAFRMGQVRSHLGLIVDTGIDGPQVLHAHPTRDVVVDRFGPRDAFRDRIVSAWMLRRWQWSAGVDGDGGAGC